MKKSILIFAIACFIGTFATSCKKKCPEPTKVTTPVLNTTSTSTVRILIESTVSTSDGKLDGQIQLVSDTVNDVVVFQKLFSAPFGGSTHTFDTTVVVNSAVLNIRTLLLTQKFTGGIYDIDYQATTYMTVWVDGVKKVYLQSVIIAEDVNLK
jgi:hypothetical protein